MASEPQTESFTERDWTDVNGEGVTPYVESKALAERAAWDFIESEAANKDGGRLGLSVVNPVGVCGPVLGPGSSTSILIVQRLFGWGRPRPSEPVFRRKIDISDVADLHLRAMTHPAASGERFLAVAGNFLSTLETAKILKTSLGQAAKRVPTMQLPNFVIRLAALRDAAVKQMIPELGDSKNATAEKAKSVLGWSPR